MPNEYQQPQQDCPSSCPTCGASDRERPVEGGLSGGNLVLWAMVFFIGPLGWAIIGAVVMPLYWPHDAAQFLGGFGGLLIGIVEAMVLAKVIRAAREKAREKKRV